MSLAALPAELSTRPCWVRHVNKRPVTRYGRAASTTDPSTWTTFEKSLDSTIGDGVGFVLDGGGIMCIDLDHCLDGDTLAPWAAFLLAMLPATYTEVSPSGTGLHVWGLGSVARGRRIRKGPVAVEWYSSGRYITVTGHVFRDAPSTLAPLGVASPHGPA